MSDNIDDKYICNICNIEFKFKSLLDTHKKRKKTCEINYLKINDNLYKCKYCSAEYSRSTYVNNHIVSCTEKIKYDKDKEIEKLKELLDEKDEKNRILTNKIQTLEIELFSMKKKKNNKIIQSVPINSTTNNTSTTNSNNTSTNNSNNTTNTNSNNTIENSNNSINNTIIVNFGKETIDGLNLKDRKEIIMECMLSIPKCVEKVHFNDALPNQKNTYLTSLKADHGFKYIDGDFVATDLDDLIDDILEKRKEDVREILENKKELKISAFTIEKIFELLDDLDSGNKEKIDLVKKDIKYVLYNNRHKVIK
jgi:hypothetical protein